MLCYMVYSVIWQPKLAHWHKQLPCSCMTGHRCRVSSSSKCKALYHAVQPSADIFLSYCMFCLRKAQCVAN